MLGAGTVNKERKRLAEIRETLRDGRQPNNVRPGRLDGPALRISIAVSADWLAVIDHCAERRGVSRSVVVREAALDGLETWWAADLELARREPILDPDSRRSFLDALPGRPARPPGPDESES